MEVTPAPLEGVLVVVPRQFPDDRGFFYESWNERSLGDVVGHRVTFVQDNHSQSKQNVLRGLHYQLPHPQGKLVRCVVGRVWDVVVDLRRSSPTFSQWFGAELSADNCLQIWVPEGFAHGFLALSSVADVLYKATDYYFPDADQGIRWDDPDIGIEWPLDGRTPILSPKDAVAPRLSECPLFD